MKASIRHSDLLSEINARFNKKNDTILVKHFGAINQKCSRLKYVIMTGQRARKHMRCCNEEGIKILPNIEYGAK